MEKNRDAYEIVGTNKVAIDRIKDELEEDRFIKEKAKDRINDLSRKIDIAKDKMRISKSMTEKMKLMARIRELENEIDNVEKSYQRVFDKSHREKYNAFLEMLIRNKKYEYITTDVGEINQQKLIRKKTPYEILGISQEKCDDSKKSTELIDRELLDRKNGLIELAKSNYEKKILEQTGKQFSTKQKLELEIKTIEEAYEKIASKVLREQYNQELNAEEERKKDDIKQQQMQLLYDKSQMCNLSLISRVHYEAVREDDEKSIIEPIVLTTNKGEEILLNYIGRIQYEDNMGLPGEIGEYEVTRTIKGKEKKDKVYICGLNISKLKKDKDTKKLKNNRYVDFIANEILSEESIEQCLRYNGGYLGEILYDNNRGEYFRFLSGIEELSAVMKFNKEKKNEHNLVEPKKYEGEEYE